MSPQTSSKLKHLGQQWIGLFPKPTNAQHTRVADDRRGRFDPTVLGFGAFGIQAEDDD